MTRFPWEMLHTHSLHAPVIWSFVAVLGDDAIPRHIRPLCLQALLMEGGTEGDVSMPQLLHFTIQNPFDCCFKGRWWVMPERQRHVPKYSEGRLCNFQRNYF